MGRREGHQERFTQFQDLTRRHGEPSVCGPGCGELLADWKSAKWDPYVRLGRGKTPFVGGVSLDGDGWIAGSQHWHVASGRREDRDYIKQGNRLLNLFNFRNLGNLAVCMSRRSFCIRKVFKFQTTINNYQFIVENSKIIILFIQITDKILI